MPDMIDKPVKVLAGRDPLTRVVIIRRPGKRFAIRSERWHERVLHEGKVEPNWVPTSAISRLFTTVELAEKEAFAGYPWLAAVPDDPH